MQYVVSLLGKKDGAGCRLSRLHLVSFLPGGAREVCTSSLSMPSLLLTSTSLSLQTEKKVIKGALGGGLVDVSGRSKSEIEEEMFGDDEDDSDDD